MNTCRWEVHSVKSIDYARLTARDCEAKRSFAGCGQLSLNPVKSLKSQGAREGMFPLTTLFYIFDSVRGQSSSRRVEAFPFLASLGKFGLRLHKQLAFSFVRFCWCPHVSSVTAAIAPGRDHKVHMRRAPVNLSKTEWSCLRAWNG